MSDTKARSDTEVLRLALNDVTGVTYHASKAGVDEMLLGLQALVANGSRDNLAKLAGSIATLLGQPPELCKPPNIRFRKLSPTVNVLPSSYAR